MLKLDECLLWAARTAPDCASNEDCSRCGWNRKECEWRKQRIEEGKLVRFRTGVRGLLLPRNREETAD